MGVPSASTEFLGHLSGLATGVLSVGEFYDWFVRALPAIEADADEATHDLATTVENILAEYSGGWITGEDATSAVREQAEWAGLDVPDLNVPTPLLVRP